MSVNTEALKQIAAMMIDAQAAQPIAIQVFNNQYSPEELAKLKEFNQKILSAVKSWGESIPA